MRKLDGERMNKTTGFLFECRKCMTEVWISKKEIQKDPLEAMGKLIEYCSNCGEEQSMVIMDFGIRPNNIRE